MWLKHLRLLMGKAVKVATSSSTQYRIVDRMLHRGVYQYQQGEYGNVMYLLRKLNYLRAQ